LAGAKVILTDEATNIAATADTDEQGVYVFTGLRPGSYMLRVETYNFASVERKNLVLAVNQRASLNVTLTRAQTRRHREMGQLLRGFA
jgi:protocatechuate 3,4-dioxygenase beta subunit